jgi:hypothetical protein
MAEKDIILEVQRIGQSNSKCCWVACYKMLYRWKGKSASEAVQKIEGAGLSTEMGLYEDQWMKAAAALGLHGMRVSHLKGLDGMAWCLEKCGPIWCAGNFGPDGSPHAVVISGLYQQDKKLRINDPYEIFQFDSYSYITHSQWCQKVREASFACQLWW